MNSISSTYCKSIGLIFFLMFLFEESNCQSIICPKSGITGFETEYTIAKMILKKNSNQVTTSDINNVSIYITVKRTGYGDFLYFHSNYKPENYRFPIKAATNQHLDLNLITSNIINIDYAHLWYNEAFKKNIKFLVDYRIFHHSKFKKLDFGKASNICIVDAKGVVHANGYKLFKTQNELKKIGYYKGVPNGIPGQNTSKAIAAFRKHYNLESDRFYVYSEGSKQIVYFPEPDDFLTELKAVHENCNQPLSFCVNSDFVSSFSIECMGQSLEINTDGELTFTIKHNNESRSITFNEKEIDADNPGKLTSGHPEFFNDPNEFLKYYKIVYTNNKKECNSLINLCVGGNTSISFEADCYGNKISASTTGAVTLSTKNGRSLDFQK